MVADTPRDRALLRDIASDRAVAERPSFIVTVDAAGLVSIVLNRLLDPKAVKDLRDLLGRIGGAA